ncbi:hypothetical protein M1432_01460 [Patescibacteria group bacterium]|nr:hypothetical protein [Patescibacteria group bacterium]
MEKYFEGYGFMDEERHDILVEESNADNQLSFGAIDFKEASGRYIRLAVWALFAGFNDDAKRLIGKIDVRFNPAESTDPSVMFAVGILARSSGWAGTNN